MNTGDSGFHVIGTPTIVLMRHGRTKLNDQQRLQGSTESVLDERGQEQSRKTGEYIRTYYDIDQVITSPRKRAHETIQHAGFANLPKQIDKRFAEIDYGEWEGEPVSERAAEMIGKWSEDVDFAPPGGESLFSLFERVSSACEELAKSRSSQTMLVCSHATPIKAAIVWSLGGDASMVLNIHSHPASISVIAQTLFGRVLVGYNERPSDHQPPALQTPFG